jgi:predicted DCC family thiol-disulfide oxidoreductase YuxK
MMPEGIETRGRLIVLYDGLCGMCDWLVQYLLRHDKKDALRFAAQQSQAAQQILARHAPEPSDLETICVIERYDSPRERVLISSDAALRIASALGGVWTLARVTRVLPRFARDAGYDFVARNRFRICGRRMECRIPAIGDQHKFLDSASAEARNRSS